ncbi:MAG: hypothetical protein ACRDOH_01140 [Streptosporangiaceae bacterium]
MPLGQCHWVRSTGSGQPPRRTANVFLAGIALAGLVLIALSALRLADTAVLVSLPTTTFLCVYLSCTVSAPSDSDNRRVIAAVR